MKILALGCKTMREGVAAASIFLLGGVLLILTSVHVIPSSAYLQHIVMWIGLVLILLAPIILISTFLLSVLPGARERHDKCEH